MPVIVTDLLHEGSSGFAVVQTTTGFGAIVGALVAGEFLTDRRRRIAIGCAIAFVATMYAVISASRELWLTALALAGFGFAFFVLSTTVQGLLIAGSPDEFRGRVMGIYTMLTAGGVPIAALIGGAIGSILGPAEAVGFAAFVMFGFLAWILVTRRLRVVRLDVKTEPLDDPSLVPVAEIDPVL
jgi:MFS family permease